MINYNYNKTRIAGILLILLFLYMYIDMSLICFAEDGMGRTKTYEELQQELEDLKKAQLVEVGFRTIDIIFGWNNVFYAVVDFCDQIINVLDNYYLWKPIKWGMYIYVGLIVVSIIANIAGIPIN